MKQNTRPPQSPESYATFWEPVVVAVPTADGCVAPVPRAEPAKDAYLEFVNVTEDAPVPPRAERR